MGSPRWSVGRAGYREGAPCVTVKQFRPGCPRLGKRRLSSNGDVTPRWRRVVIHSTVALPESRPCRPSRARHVPLGCAARSAAAFI